MNISWNAPIVINDESGACTLFGQRVHTSKSLSTGVCTECSRFFTNTARQACLPAYNCPRDLCVCECMGIGTSDCHHMCTARAYLSAVQRTRLPYVLSSQTRPCVGPFVHIPQPCLNILLLCLDNLGPALPFVTLGRSFRLGIFLHPEISQTYCTDISAMQCTNLPS